MENLIIQNNNHNLIINKLKQINEIIKYLEDEILYLLDNETNELDNIIKTINEYIESFKTITLNCNI
jgi:hypothetical protein